MDTKIVLFDGLGHNSLKPLTYLNPVAALRIGILTIQEKWEAYLGQEVFVRTKDYLSVLHDSMDDNADLGICAQVIPNEELVEAILSLQDKEILFWNDKLIAISNLPSANAHLETALNDYNKVVYEGEITGIWNTWNIFKENGNEIKNDFDIVCLDRNSEELHPSNQVIGNPNLLFIEEGCEIYCSTFNTTEGPIYIGNNAKVLEGSHIKGPFALCEEAVVKMGSKMYQDTTIGPHCKVGGEISNSVLMAYSNKGHDGYLGNSVIGEWCNLGADTNTSNLKNNYSPVKVYSIANENMEETGLQFCGTIMGDHSKTSINTMLNTGTVVGCFANIFDGGFPPKYIPNFAWGGKDKMEIFQLEKAFEAAERMMERRKIKLSEAHKKAIEHLYKQDKRAK